MNPIILIPARLKATRLPGKPLADDCGERSDDRACVWRRAVESGIGEVIVACGEKEIADAIGKAGGRAVMTDPELPSGSDRIWQALTGQSTLKANTMPSSISRATCLAARFFHYKTVPIPLLDDPKADIGTLAAVITDERRRKSDPAVVKAVISETG